MFIAPQLNSNVAGLEELRKVVDAFVRADQLFQLMRGGGLGTGIAGAAHGLLPRSRGIPIIPGLFSPPEGPAVDARGRAVSFLQAGNAGYTPVESRIRRRFVFSTSNDPAVTAP